MPYKSMAFYMHLLYHCKMAKVGFEWNAEKDIANLEKHGVSFSVAQYAFADPLRIIARDETHSLDSPFYVS